MSNKPSIWIGLILGSAIGGGLPLLFGQGLFSTWENVGSALGGLIGIYLGYKLGERL